MTQTKVKERKKGKETQPRKRERRQKSSSAGNQICILDKIRAVVHFMYFLSILFSLTLSSSSFSHSTAAVHFDLKSGESSTI